MSLLGRLWFSVFMAMLLGLFGCFGVSVYTARNYLTQQLLAQANDGAASLALSMSQQKKNPAMRELLVTALFDSGHFESIIYRDANGEIEVERHTTAPDPLAPLWFVRLIPLEAPPGEALVSDGWTQMGKVEVRASARYAYTELWNGTLQLAMMLGSIGVMLCLIVALLMRWAAKPLRAIVGQAVAIGFRRFMTLPEPQVPELRLIGRAMNTMVRRVQAMFNEQAARIEQLRNESNRDSLTQLPNRNVFIGGVNSIMHDEQAAPAGIAAVVRIQDLAGINHRLGRDRADLLIKTIANLLKTITLQFDDSATVARLNGADFGLILPTLDAELIKQLCTQLLKGFDDLYRQDYTDRDQIAAIGWTVYKRGETATDIMLRMDACLMQAEAATPAVAGDAGTHPYIAVPSDEWRTRFQQALKRKSFHLAFFPVLRIDGSLIHHEAMLRMEDTGSQETHILTAGQFMPAASRLEMTAEVDLLTLELAVDYLQNKPQDDIAVNISSLSLSNPYFLQSIRTQLQRAGALARHLWIELSERTLPEDGDLNRLNEFAHLLSEAGCKLGIEHFGRHFSAMPRLHAMSVDYLKLDGSFVTNIEQHDGNQRFVKAVIDVANSLEIEVIAERVASEAEWAKLAALGVFGVTGPAATKRFN